MFSIIFCTLSLFPQVVIMLVMKWIEKFDLFLFDFDGLLVDTERLHFLAYQTLCKRHNCELSWSFEHYCTIAHADAEGLKKEIYQAFPLLYQKEPSWQNLYMEKKRIYLELLENGRLQLMPGVETLLNALFKSNISRAVATHSPREQIEKIKSSLPILNSIPNWITREDYIHPKPAPDAYLTAIERVGKSTDRIIGFEDSLRGLRALQATPALAVLIAPDCPSNLGKNTLHFTSLADCSLQFGM